jgi:hypothetical protein
MMYRYPKLLIEPNRAITGVVVYIKWPLGLNWSGMKERKKEKKPLELEHSTHTFLIPGHVVHPKSTGS